MQYIKVQLEMKNPSLFEENIEEFVKSISIGGLLGTDIPTDNIIEMSFSAWEMLIQPEEGMSLKETIGLIKRICQDFQIKIIDIQTFTDSLDYTTQEESRYSIDMGSFVIFNNLQDYNNFYSIKKSPIFINERTAFGTGRHETTALCIDELCTLKERGLAVSKALDLGTGTGVLAIVISKLFNAEVVAADIDEIAINTAIDFIKINGENKNIHCLVSEGFKDITVKGFDLIIANILLNPLLEMVEDFYDSLKIGGYLVLSGVLDHQVDILVKQFEEASFKFLDKKERNSWGLVVFKK